MPLVTKSFANAVSFTRASSATYFDSSGVLQTASTNTARIDYNPITLAIRGLLVEEQRTNLCLHSEDFANVAWNKFNSTVTSNSSTSPSGTTTADTLSASTSDGVITQDIIVSTNTNYTFSVFLKSDTTTNLTLFLFTTSFATISSQAITVTNSWQRFTVSGNSGVNATIRVSIGGGNTFSSPEIVYAWGAQLEAGAFATSYIATTAASATRSADVAIVNVNRWFYDTESTIYIETAIEGVGSSTIYPWSVAIDNGTGSNRYGFYLNDPAGDTYNKKMLTGAVGQIDEIGPITLVPNTFIKSAMAVKYNDFAAAYNGGNLQTDTSVNIPTNLTRLLIGSGDNTWSGWIKSVKYYPRRLTDVELQALTT